MRTEPEHKTMFTAAKMGLLGSLYFSQGLPFGFFTQALPLLLRWQGVSLGEIGLSSLLAVPWAGRFLWAPVVDRQWNSALGRRRSWIIPLQLASMLFLAALALSGTSSMALLMTAVALLNLIAATQDIATDGLAVDLLDPAERGFANGLQVAGYRVGMIVGGGVLLVLYARLGSTGTYLAMAALIAAASLPTIIVREPDRLHDGLVLPGPERHGLHRTGERRGAGHRCSVGRSAQAFGYPGHFCLATILAGAALAVVGRFFPDDQTVRTVRGDTTTEVGACD